MHLKNKIPGNNMDNEAPTPETERGLVNAYDTFKGIGFIRREKGKDVFFFYDDIVGDSGVSVGDTVTFTIVKMPKGPRAYNVTVINPY